MPFAAPALLYEEIACKHREDLLHYTLRKKLVGIPSSLLLLERWQVRGLAVRVIIVI